MVWLADGKADCSISLDGPQQLVLAGRLLQLTAERSIVGDLQFQDEAEDPDESDDVDDDDGLDPDQEERQMCIRDSGGSGFRGGKGRVVGEGGAETGGFGGRPGAREVLQGRGTAEAG